MAITIIIDKSTFQMLSYPELVRLGAYYGHNVTPILVREILGDLKKETGEGKTPSEDRVKNFAQKLFPRDNAINSHFEELVREDLITGNVSADGRPAVQIEKVVEDADGKMGMLIKETPDERLIYKWKQGKFSEDDKRFAALWRASTTQEDILQKLQTTLRERYGKLELKTYEELNQLAEKLLTDESKQQGFLVYLLENYTRDAQVGLVVLARWQRAENRLLKVFAPYAFHCLKVDMLFSLGLQSGLIGTRPTNRVDMEYFYYLPFCNVFTSNDKVHSKLVQCLLREDQSFVGGPELKADMHNIVEYIEAGGAEALKKYKRNPPIIEESFTFQLWKKYYDYPNRQPWNRKISEKEFEEMKKKMDGFTAAVKGNPVDGITHSDDADFIVRHSWMTKDDPCPICGSGKRVVECCMTEEDFDRIAKESQEE